MADVAFPWKVARPGHTRHPGRRGYYRRPGLSIDLMF